MPFWLYWTITSLAFLTAFYCPKCQNFANPNKPEIGQVITAIRETPVFKQSPEDTIHVMIIRRSHEYYRQIYLDVVKCSGLQDDVAYEETTFYVSDFPEFDINGERAIAYYEPESNSIVFSLAGVWQKKVVGHELLHMLLQKYGLQDPRNKDEDQHPMYWFNDSRKCKGVVFPH